MDINKYTPLMTLSEFASCVGVSEGVVEGWVKRNYVPTHKIGRHRLVNVAKLSDSLISGDFGELKLGKESQPLDSADGSVKASEEQLDLFNKLPRNKRRNLKKKYGSEDAAAISVCR